MNATRLRNKQKENPFFGKYYNTLTQIQRKRIVHIITKKTLFFFFPTKNNEEGD